MARLEIFTATLHKDINDFEKQRYVNKLRIMMEDIETTKTKGTAIRARSR